VNEPNLDRVIRLAQGSSRRFQTLQLTIRDWANYARVCRSQGLPWDGAAEEEGEELVRLCTDGPRMRVDDRVWIGVRDHDRWWAIARDGQRRHSQEREPGSSLDDWVDEWPHFWDASWLRRRGTRVIGACEVAGLPPELFEEPR
jgi:hypothetical protein